MKADNQVNYTKDSITVYGNCGMCASRIETAALSVIGVDSAAWDSENNRLIVTYDSSISTIEKIHQAIAAVGHDTNLIKADDKVYKKLPGCCQYDRPLSK